MQGRTVLEHALLRIGDQGLCRSGNQPWVDRLHHLGDVSPVASVEKNTFFWKGDGGLGGGRRRLDDGKYSLQIKDTMVIRYDKMQPQGEL